MKMKQDMAPAAMLSTHHQDSKMMRIEIPMKRTEVSKTRLRVHEASAHSVQLRSILAALSFHIHRTSSSAPLVKDNINSPVAYSSPYAAALDFASFSAVAAGALDLLNAEDIAAVNVPIARSRRRRPITNEKPFSAMCRLHSFRVDDVSVVIVVKFVVLLYWPMPSRNLELISPYIIPRFFGDKSSPLLPLVGGELCWNFVCFLKSLSPIVYPPCLVIAASSLMSSLGCLFPLMLIVSISKTLPAELFALLICEDKEEEEGGQGGDTEEDAALCEPAFALLVGGNSNLGE
mmetsp:Transcript_550/g.820  ORF Transcript_550/g.820 Transcript_550/m.820 type:complete len:290 (-) Transcript_550:192-1061(-)